MYMKLFIVEYLSVKIGIIYYFLISIFNFYIYFLNIFVQVDFRKEQIFLRF